MSMITYGSRANRKQMALEIVHHSLLHVLEDATLKQALAICVTLDRMAIVVLPFTVHDQPLFNSRNTRTSESR